MKIGFLTSSRADFGIYYPLIEKLIQDQFFTIEIIAFGTHLSKYHGYTVEEIKKNVGETTIHEISALISNDNPEAISSSFALTALKFATFWNCNHFDLVFCLGDRFEMNAAVQAGIPFNVRFAHLHGGETTLGAIDNIYRHQISLAATFHFASTQLHAERVKELTGNQEHTYDLGSLSLDGLEDFKPTAKADFLQQYQIPDEDFALITFHPETVSIDYNQQYALEMKKGLEQISKKLFLVVTMPNADTLGTVFRASLIELKAEIPDRIVLIENFGKQNYFTAMQYCRMLVGNTSSGIIEAASFYKYVLNVGDRQKGRHQSPNCFNVSFNAHEMENKVIQMLELESYRGTNIYYKTNVSDTIIKILKSNEKL